MKVLFKLSPFCILLFIGCNQSVPEIIIPESYIIGEDLTVLIRGLQPQEEYTLYVEKKDQLERLWSNSNNYISDKSGEIDLNAQSPISGTYSHADINGHLYSMTMLSKQGDDWIPPPPKDYSSISYSLIHNSDSLDKTSLKQWIIPPSLIKENVSDPIVAEIFTPENISSPLPGIILLGGSGGGLSWASRMGALLAKEGYVTMALAYFNAEGLPEHLAQIPLEYVDQAITLLSERTDTDPNRMGIMGYSKGAELALLVASRNEDIKCVATIAPGSIVSQGFKPPKYPVISSWSYQGKDLDFVPNAYDDKFFQTFDGMYLWYKTLGQHEAVESAAIPVENISGNILMITGVEDQIWPTTYMAEQIVARLHIAEFKFDCKHLSFANAGHGIAEPAGHPTTSVSQRLGGTPEGNSKARETMWKEVKKFFSNSLKGN